MTIVRTRRYACHAHREKGTCGNPRGIDAGRIENEVCSLLARHIADRDGLAVLMRRAAGEAARRRRELSGDIADREARIRRLLDAVETGARPAAALGRIVEIERETAALEIERRALPDIPAAAPDGFAARLRERLAVLDRAIRAPDTGRARRNRALLMAGSLIERIDIAPLPGRGQVDISIRPRTDALVALALRESWEFEAGRLRPVPIGRRDA